MSTSKSREPRFPRAPSYECSTFAKQTSRKGTSLALEKRTSLALEDNRFTATAEDNRFIATAEDNRFIATAEDNRFIATAEDNRLQNSCYIFIKRCIGFFVQRFILCNVLFVVV